jgi:aminoacrylate hydrolase
MAQKVAIDGGVLAYETAGVGAPVLFVAGLGGHASYWKLQVSAVARDFQTVSFDHRGVGASEGLPPYSVEQWAADTRRLMDHLKLSMVHLIGHSSDGAIAQTVAATRPDRVATLVLGGTWARPDARFTQLFEFRKRVLLEMGSEIYEDLGRTLTPPVGLERAPAAQRVARHTPSDIVAARIDALLAYDAGERLCGIRSPTLVVAADDDVLVPRQLNGVIADEIAHARLVTFEWGGHHFPQTQAGAYNRLLLDFFRGHAKGDARE